MRVGLIDVDGHNFPNLPLMKISAWHKHHGDSVEWYEALGSGHMDKVYMSKVFSFTDDYPYFIDADVVERGGSGYCISVVDGLEVYDKSKDKDLPDEIEHIYPDYSIYGITDTAYGFLSRGCPRGCDFCHVACKEGRVSRKVADLSEFWDGQPNICLCDPNILACPDWHDLLTQLADSGSAVEFNQGLDIRMMTKEKADLLNMIKVKRLHFAWDKYEDKEMIVPRFEQFCETTKVNRRDISVYVLCGFNTSIDQDLERIYTLRRMGYSPYVMLYDKQSIPRGHILHRLQRWVNSRMIFWSVDNFDDYVAGGGR